MEVSFRHANPRSGNESFVVRFEGAEYAETPCLLVDSGFDVDVESLLADSERLVGVLLTHAHSDHYHTLSRNLIGGATVYASPGTAAVLESVLDEGSRHQELGDTDAILDSLVAIDGWETVASGVRVHAIPAGHAPGAAGFVIQFESDDGWKTMVATGDFTLTRAGGYPGLPTDLVYDVDALFLTAATSLADERPDLFSTAIGRAVGGAPVLLTATGLSCVEYAYLLGHLVDEFGEDVPITIAGQAAKLYQTLGYDVPHVTPVPTFERPENHLTNGGITLAGPQVPSEGASGRFFQTIRDDGGAVLVQALDGAERPIQRASCTVRSHSHIAHPTESEIDALVRNIEPIEVVITHQQGSGARRFRDKYASYVWATDDEDWHRLFDGAWRAPPWVSDAGKSYVREEGRQMAAISVNGGLPLPSLDRHDEVDFEAEGLDPSGVRPELLTGSTP